MARVLLTIDEPLGRTDGRMAGLGVRVHEMADALGRVGHAVTVAAPPGDGEPPAGRYDVVSPETVARLSGLDVWITHPRLVEGYRHALADVALVVDGYESPFGSYLAQAAALLPTLGDRVVYEYRADSTRRLAAFAAADRVLCATESQRISYLTLLAAIGRIGPRTPETDIVLRVCSGAPPVPAASTSARADEARAPVLLWAGGCYPWFDVETPLAALVRIVDAVPAVRIVLAGLGGIDEEHAVPFPKARRVHEVVAGTRALADRVVFAPWQAYATRDVLYRQADVGLSSYGDHLETALAMRTRVIDMIWGGLPVVTSAGDEIGRLVAAAGAGVIVPAADPDRLADAVVTLLRDPACRRAMAARARALATHDLAWDRQIEPLDRYCRIVAARGPARTPRWPDAEAILRPNDGWGRRGADALRALWRRLEGAKRRLGAPSERAGS